MHMWLEVKVECIDAVAVWGPLKALIYELKKKKKFTRESSFMKAKRYLRMKINKWLSVERWISWEYQKWLMEQTKFDYLWRLT